MLSDPSRIHASPNPSDPRRSFDSAQQYVDDGASIAESVITPLPEPKLPDLNLSSLDLAMSLESILSTTVAAEPE